MAHGITSIDKQEGITQAWHGLTSIREDLSVSNNWLNDWDLEKTPLFIQNKEGRFITVPNQYMLISTDNASIIGKPFGKSYAPVYNHQFLKLVENLVNKSENSIKIVSVGSVCGRTRVFVSLKIEGHDKFTTGGREFQEYMNFGNSFDQSSALWVNNSNVCIVCNNTFSYNLFSPETKPFEKVRHSGNIQVKLDNLSGAVENFILSQNEFKEKFNHLAEKKVSDEFADNVFAGWVVDEKQLESESISSASIYAIKNLSQLYRTGAGNGNSTLADMFSAVTDYYTHNERGKNRFTNNRIYYSDYGTGLKRKQHFWNVLTPNDDGTSNKMLDMYADRGQRVYDILSKAA